MFALMGLLIAFTFSGGLTRFDERRAQVVEEANAIGTAYLRVDLLPAAAQPKLREAFRQYLDTRIATYRKLPDLAAAREELARSQQLQAEIWQQAVAAARSAENRPMLFGLALAAALLAGYQAAGERSLDWVHQLGFAAIVAFAF